MWELVPTSWDRVDISDGTCRSGNCVRAASAIGGQFSALFRAVNLDRAAVNHFAASRK